MSSSGSGFDSVRSSSHLVRASASDNLASHGDSTMMHGLGRVAYPSGVTQLGVHPEDRTAGPTPCTTSRFRYLNSDCPAQGKPDA